MTLIAPFAGKIMRCRDVGDVVRPSDVVTELTGVGKPTWELFVAYRQSDAPGHAGRIGADLRSYFGPGQVFKDVDSLPLGVDYIAFIREKLQRAFVMVVVIGPSWLKDPRLRLADDLHREEIRTALQRGIKLIPVFVHGASPPSGRAKWWRFWEKRLPQDIRALLRQNGVEVSDKRWDYDVGTLIATIEGALAESPRRKRFLAQVPPWDFKGGWQWIADDPSLDDEPLKYE